MGRKRKANGVTSDQKPPKATKYDFEETFNDSEDEFYAGRDKVLLEQGPDSKRRRRLADQEQDLQPSDEEILAYSEESDDNDLEYEEEAGGVERDEEESAEENWGTNKADYYNTDVIETEADALEEEAEARRLQQKQLTGMTEADFGLDSTWTETSDLKVQKRSRIEKLPETQIPDNATQAQRKDILYSRYPEAQLLVRDLVDLQTAERDLRLLSADQQAKLNNGGRYGPGITARTKLQAISTYLASITLYFGVLASKAGSEPSDRTITALNPTEIREHPIIEALATSKTTWDRIRRIATAEVLPRVKEAVRSDQEQEVDRRGPSQSVVDTGMVNVKPVKKKTKVELVEKKKPKEKKSKYTNLQDLLAKSVVEDDETSQFGDEQPLTQEQVEEKAKKRKSLRFYTSQIVQKANKRGTASRVAGGDDDVPHKERLRDRQDRLIREAEARGKSQANEEEQLDDDPVIEDNIAEEDGYYQTLVNRSDRKKADKQARADAYAEASRQGGQVFEEETVGPDGKRAITYAIEKNKGLTPKRSKDVRNPRVKKRKKYDEKMKKLGSIRQVYKGGEGRGGYGGELTGIKANIVRGVRL